MYYLACIDGADVLDKINEAVKNNARFAVNNSTGFYWLASWFRDLYHGSKPLQVWEVVDFRTASRFDNKTVLQVASEQGNLDFINKVKDLTGNNVYSSDEFRAAEEQAIAKCKEVGSAPRIGI